ncbi:MAG: DUF6055 domain-containing protein [Candidatus Alcyoniella australis]|nr:DUF6055 domain-containing protein [Candidatus Alcyoniella australis]
MRHLSLIIAAFAALVLLYASPALAGPTLDLDATLDAIDADRVNGELSYEQALVAKVHALSGGGQDSQYAQPGVGGASLSQPQCGTPVILEVLAAYDSLSDWARDEIDAVLLVGGDQSFTPPTLPDKARIPRPGHDTPFSEQSEHFNIKWGTLNPPTTLQVELMIEALEQSWDTEVVAMGYPAPSSSGSYLVDIYVGNSGDVGENVPDIGFAGAYTSIYMQDNYNLETPEMSYIVMHPDILEYEPAIQEISAHEFFHVLQFAIWLINYPHGYFDSESNWWWEATAVWMEDQVYDDVNQYIYFLNYYMENPHQSLHQFSSGAPHQYGMCIWARYLDQYYDGEQTIYDLWIDPHPAGILVATDEYATDFNDTDLETVFSDFVAKVAMDDLEESQMWDEVEITQTVSDYPYVQQDDEVAKTERPRIIGANFYRLRPGSAEGTLLIEFNGQNTYEDNDIDWLVTVVAVGGGKADYEVLQLLTDDEGEEGSIEINGFGNDYDEVWLIPTPFPSKIRAVDKFGTSRSFKYSWAADITQSSGDDDDDDAGDDDDDSSAGCCG